MPTVKQPWASSFEARLGRSSPGIESATSITWWRFRLPLQTAGSRPISGLHLR